MTVIMGVVVALTFLFGFGNVWTLALRLGVPVWVAPLVAPAVDLSVMGLLLGTRFLALHGARPEQLRPARRLLVFAGVMTLALNVTDPLLAGQWGKAAFDAVGPLLLIGWAEVGPGLLQTIADVQRHRASGLDSRSDRHGTAVVTSQGQGSEVEPGVSGRISASGRYASVTERPSCGDDLLERARQEDVRHRQVCQRPVSAETLRRQFRIGAARSRMLVAMVRAEDDPPADHHG
ncbi:SpdA protein [Streptomyces aurantiacus]|uniref:SpdA protein n=1 Tax=Streptomyces aurantiacus TaxID=47760 RepID=UPI0027D8B95A|nr:SpdA protein [Streptomyces aurantiacus]